MVNLPVVALNRTDLNEKALFVYDPLIRQSFNVYLEEAFAAKLMISLLPANPASASQQSIKLTFSIEKSIGVVASLE